MDQRTEEPAGPSIVVTGHGHVVSGPAGAGASPPARREPCDPTPYLEIKKNRKFMGIQDDLAVVSAGLALASAKLAGVRPGEAAGLYLAVGYIPFEQDELDALLSGSVDGGEFSMSSFSTTGIRAVKPLITFRCLPNMPAFHVSANFDIQGPYFVTYPGAGQFYLAMEEACVGLRRGEIAYALVGAVADQQNFLVRHHFERMGDGTAAARLADAAGCLVLETEAHAAARGAAVRARLLSCEVGYQPFDPRNGLGPTRDTFSGYETEDLLALGELGPASLPVVLSRESAWRREAPALFRHSVRCGDGLTAASQWELP